MFLRQSFVNLLTLFATVCTLFLTSGLYAGTSLNSLAIANNFPDAVTGFEFPDEPREWLLIGTAPGSFGTTVSVNSGFELGAHLPLDGAIPTSGGGQGPDLSSVTKPTGAADPSIGIGLNGDTALTSNTGKFNFQTLDGDGLLNRTALQKLKFTSAPRR